jgi:small-conductance mechanosensitive channel
MDDPTGFLRYLKLEGLPLTIVIVAMALVVSSASTRALRNLGARFPGWRIALKQGSAVLRFTVFILASVAVVTNLVRLTDEVVLALGGSVAVAVGFAFKDLVASLMAGILILFDRPFQVGDRVRVGDTYGEVVEIGLRATRIVTLDDTLVSIPNNTFLNDAVGSANAGALDQMCVMKFYITPLEDFELGKRLVYEATVSSRFVYLRKPVVVHFDETPIAGMDAVIAFHLTVKAYVMDGRFERAFATDVHERVKRAFRQARIRTSGDVLASAELEGSQAGV